MLSKLTISNYALIDHIEIGFNKGLTIITGETGAGKSIIMGALSLILGGRADVKSIRDKSHKSIVEATFDISGFDLKEFFDSNDIEYYEDECILRKEFSDSGRSRTFVNDTPVSLSMMKDLTMNLIDIHSQHSNLLISNQNYQLSVVDNLAKDKDVLDDYKEKFKAYQELSRQLEEAKSRLTHNKEEEDYIRFQLDQFHALKLVKGEEEELEAEQKKLSNITEIKESLWSAESLLDGEENSIIENLRSATKSVTTASENLLEVKELAERLDSTIIEIKDVTMAISNIQEGLELNPDELERINDRLNAIYSLESKHSVSSTKELLEIQAGYEEKISLIDNSDEDIAKLEKRVSEAYKTAKDAAVKLSGIRKKVAQKFADELKAMVMPLGLKNVRFEVAFSEQGLNVNGMDSVKFMIAFNKNQELMPVENTASGGELSRLMLSIKAIIAKSMNLPTIIFDEVDTGVSGDVADKIGEMMGAMAERIQVIAITHLPQVAAMGDNHIKVFKQDREDSTVTSIKELDADDRVREIAGMLSGKEITQSAIENAMSLLKR